MPTHELAGRCGEQIGEELWPLRLNPYPDELFSSWLVRQAREYEMSFAAFCRAVWPEGKRWRDIDREIDDEALYLLSRKTGVSYAELFWMTLPDAYFRKEWRLDFFLLCAEHRIPLLEACTRCGGACLFANVPPQYPLSSCHSCRGFLAYCESQCENVNSTKNN